MDYKIVKDAQLSAEILLEDFNFLLIINGLFINEIIKGDKKLQEAIKGALMVNPTADIRVHLVSENITDQMPAVQF